MGTLTVRHLTVGIFCLVVAISPGDIGAQDPKNLENDLRHALEHKFLSLKTPYFGSRLHFDSSGNLVGNAVAGPWTTCGVLKTEELVVGSDHIEIDGTRVILALRSKTSDRPIKDSSSLFLSDTRLEPIEADDRVRIFVDISSSDVVEVTKILSQVFQSPQISERMAGYWKPKAADPNLLSNSPNAIEGELEGNRPVYHLGKKIGAGWALPKPTHKPEPKFTDAARQEKIQGVALVGVVVNEKGFPEILEILSHLTDKLDIQAIKAVAGWTFKPALKDGQPVAVEIAVEVDFHLH